MTPHDAVVAVEPEKVDFLSHLSIFAINLRFVQSALISETTTVSAFEKKENNKQIEE